MQIHSNRSLCLRFFWRLIFLLPLTLWACDKDPLPQGGDSDSHGEQEDSRGSDAKEEDKDLTDPEDLEDANLGDAGEGGDEDSGGEALEDSNEGDAGDSSEDGDLEGPSEGDEDGKGPGEGDADTEGGDEGHEDAADSVNEGGDDSEGGDNTGGDTGEGQEACGSQSYLDENGNCQAWTACAPGTYIKVPGTGERDQSCQPCGEGFYSDSENSPRCLPFSPCHAGQKIAAMGSKTQDQLCETCESGTFSSTTNALTCESLSHCGPGQYVLRDGSRSQDRLCATCDEGSFSSTDNSPSCKAFSTCAKGSQIAKEGTLSEDRQCEACQEGYFSDSENAESCSILSTCEKGSFVSFPGSKTADRSCQACPAGRYSDESNAPSCRAQVICEKGSYVLEVGSAEKAQVCTSCPSGSFSSSKNASACESYSVCDSGTYVKEAGSPINDQVCAPCSDGTFTSGPNQESCQAFTACEKGSFVIERGTATSDFQCGLCPEGSFSSQTNANSCKPHAHCPKGTHVLEEGSPESDRICSPCEEGSFASEENQAACLPFPGCAPGTAISVPGSSQSPPQCASCESGYYSEGGLRESCEKQVDCGFGSFVSKEGNSSQKRECSPCPSGSYSNSINASACIPQQDCGAGSVVLIEGSATQDRTCGNCEPGTTTYAQNESECVHCEECYADKSIFKHAPTSFLMALEYYNSDMCRPLLEDMDAIEGIQAWEDELIDGIFEILPSINPDFVFENNITRSAYAAAMASLATQYAYLYNPGPPSVILHSEYQPLPSICEQVGRLLGARGYPTAAARMPENALELSLPFVPIPAEYSEAIEDFSRLGMQLYVTPFMSYSDEPEVILARTAMVSSLLSAISRQPEFAPSLIPSVYYLGGPLITPNRDHRLISHLTTSMVTSGILLDLARQPELFHILLATSTALGILPSHNIQNSPEFEISSNIINESYKHAVARQPEARDRFLRSIRYMTHLLDLRPLCSADDEDGVERLLRLINSIKYDPSVQQQPEAAAWILEFEILACDPSTFLAPEDLCAEINELEFSALQYIVSQLYWFYTSELETAEDKMRDARENNAELISLLQEGQRELENLWTCKARNPNACNPNFETCQDRSCADEWFACEQVKYVNLLDNPFRPGNSNFLSDLIGCEYYPARSAYISGLLDLYQSYPEQQYNRNFEVFEQLEGLLIWTYEAAEACDYWPK